MKRGQITFFVILGLVILSLIVLMFVFKEEVLEQASKVGIVKGVVMSEEAKKLRLELTSCMEGVAQSSLTQLGLQGGYLDLENVPYTTSAKEVDVLGYDGTAYLYYKGQNKVPSLRQIQSQLTKDLTEASKFCKKDYEEFDTTYGRVIPKISLAEDKIKFDIAWVIEIQKGDTKSLIRDMKFEFPVRLGRVRNVANEIVSEQEDGICLSCLAEIGYENDVEITIENVDGDIFYLITDDNSKINYRSYLFLMANRF